MHRKYKLQEIIFLLRGENMQNQETVEQRKKHEDSEF